MLFVTHFSRLIEYLETFPNVKRVSLHHEPTGGRKVKVGGGKLTRGGIKLLSKLGFAANIINEATVMLEKVNRTTARSSSDVLD